MKYNYLKKNRDYDKKNIMSINIYMIKLLIMMGTLKQITLF
jgi:hypothetical protein